MHRLLDIDWWYQTALVAWTVLWTLLLDQLGWNSRVVQMTVTCCAMDMVMGMLKAIWTRTFETDKLKRGFRKWMVYAVGLVLVRHLSQPWGVVTDWIYAQFAVGLCVYIATVEAISCMLNLEAIAKHEGVSLPIVSATVQKLVRWKEQFDAQSREVSVGGGPVESHPGHPGRNGPPGPGAAGAHQDDCDADAGRATRPKEFMD